MSASSTAGEIILRLLFRCIGRARAVLLVAAASIVFAAPGLWLLDFRLDGLALAPPNSAASRADAAMRGTFGLHDEFVLFLQGPQPGALLDAPSLGRVLELTRAILRIEQVRGEHVVSLATESRDRINSWDYSPFLTPLPATAEEIASLRQDIEAIAILKGTLVAPDYSGAVILVRVPDQVDRETLYQSLSDAVAGIELGDDRLHIVGAPAAEILLGRHLLIDLLRLLPLCVLLLAAGLWWAFRRVSAIGVVMAHVAGCLMLTFGLMGWSGQPLYITTAVLPLILCTMSIASEVHLLVTVQNVLRSPEAGCESWIQRALREVYVPLCLTVLTTAIGFASFMVSDLPAVRAFGLWATVGTVISLAWSLLCTPALYAALGAQRLRGRERNAQRLMPAIAVLDRVARVRWMPLAVAGVLLVVGAGLSRLELQDSWIGGFARRSEFYESVERVNAAVLGTHLLRLHVDFRSTGATSGLRPFHDPKVVNALGSMEHALRSDPRVGGVIGPWSHLTTTRYLASGRVPNSGLLVDDPVDYRRLWRHIEFARGEARRREIVSDGMDQGLITVFLRHANYVDTQEVMKLVRDLAEERLSPLGGKLSFAGDVAVSQEMIAANVRGQLASLSLGVLSLFAVLLITLRRLSLAAFAVLPVTAACVCVLGVMGWFAIPVGVATSMFVAIALGIGIDFPLYLLKSIDAQRRRGVHAPVSRAKSLVGPAILINSLVVGAGFGILALSQVPSNARLGALVAVAVIASCACTLLLVRDRPQERTASLTSVAQARAESSTT